MMFSKIKKFFSKEKEKKEDGYLWYAARMHQETFTKAGGSANDVFLDNPYVKQLIDSNKTDEEKTNG